jgi:hypothetical protein
MVSTSGTDRKAPEINGKRRQHSGLEDRGIISTAFGCFLPKRTGTWPEKFENLPTRNTASMKTPEFLGTDLFLAVLSDLGIDALFSIEIFEYYFSFLTRELSQMSTSVQRHILLIDRAHSVHGYPRMVRALSALLQRNKRNKFL